MFHLGQNWWCGSRPRSTGLSRLPEVLSHPWNPRLGRLLPHPESLLTMANFRNQPTQADENTSSQEYMHFISPSNVTICAAWLTRRSSPPCSKDVFVEAPDGRLRLAERCFSHGHGSAGVQSMLLFKLIFAKLQCGNLLHPRQIRFSVAKTISGPYSRDTHRMLRIDNLCPGRDYLVIHRNPSRQA